MDGREKRNGRKSRRERREKKTKGRWPVRGEGIREWGERGRVRR